MGKERSAQATEDTWDLAPLFVDQNEWEKKFNSIKQNFCQDIVDFKGKLKEGVQTIKKIFDLNFATEQELMRLYTYAHLRHDEDIAHETHKSAHDRISALLYQFSEATAWLEPELLSMPVDELHSLAKADELIDYAHILDRILRRKPHTLSAREEELLALAGKSLEASQKSFGALNNADLKFPPVKDSEGKEHEVTHSLAGVYLRSPDRELRKNAFMSLNGTFSDFENTCCELLNGAVQKHIFEAKARRYDNALHAALFPHQIDTAVYTNLVDATHKHLDKLHAYVDLRKKLMNLDTVHAYDLYAPISKAVDMQFPYDKAVDLILEAVQPLGPSYCAVLERGFKEERWVDRYENMRKRSGAYSSGCYESYPYMLLNYQEHLNDVMTLAHEAGHSMHTYFSNQSQPYHHSHYSIFVAEVASTFNEELVFRHLLKNAQSVEEKRFLILQKLDGIRATFFRQVQFAEFELQIHEMAEKDIPLTPATLRKAYRELNQNYFGNSFTVDPELEAEFMRVPHFYYNFYVYQYATGISAAFALVEQVLKEGARRYLDFLSAGGSDYPLEVLKTAGVDMCSSQPIDALMTRFDTLMHDLK